MYRLIQTTNIVTNRVVSRIRDQRNGRQEAMINEYSVRKCNVISSTGTTQWKILQHHLLLLIRSVLYFKVCSKNVCP